MKTFGICTILLVVLLLFVIYFIDSNKKKKKRKESYHNVYKDDNIESFNNTTDENVDSFNNINNSRGFNDATNNSGSIIAEKENNNENEMNEIIGNNNVNNNYKKNRESSCFPKNQLTAAELLPQDNSSTWAQVNPTGSGTLKDKNFLQAGHHIGINTVGQTLRNANMQLRSEPPNPQVKVSPWLQTTIEPDMGRKPMEIGGCN